MLWCMSVNGGDQSRNFYFSDNWQWHNLDDIYNTMTWCMQHTLTTLPAGKIEPCLGIFLNISWIPVWHMSDVAWGAGPHMVSPGDTAPDHDHDCVKLSDSRPSPPLLLCCRHFKSSGHNVWNLILLTIQFFYPHLIWWQNCWRIWLLPSAANIL